MSYELAIKIMEYINNNQSLQNRVIKSEVILFVGLTGSGKSTLINYLNGVKLLSYSTDKGISYKLKAKGAELEDIKIGTSDNISCTRIPGVHSPEKSFCSYVDMSGFDDTGDLINDKNNINKERVKIERAARDIANAYYRKAILDKANKIKVVLVISYIDLVHGKGRVPESLKDLAYLLNSIESDDPAITEKIKNAISIVITRVPNQSNNLSELKESIRDILDKFTEESPGLDAIKNMRQILSYIVLQDRFELFTTPTNECEKNENEASIINDLINSRTNCITHNEADVSVKVPDKYAGDVMKAIKSLNVLGRDLKECIDTEISQEVEAAFRNGHRNIPKLNEIMSACEKVKGFKTPRLLKTLFTEINKEFPFFQESVKKYEEFNKLLTFLVGLLPKEDQEKYSDKKNWLVELELLPVLDNHISCVNDILNKPKDNFADSKLVIQGCFIRISEVNKLVQKYKGIKAIEIHALHTITIDCDLIMSGINISMIAPNVEVEGNKKIDLSGISKTGLAKAANGANGSDGLMVGPGTKGNDGQNGNHGADGLVGESGTSSGNLFIVSETFTGRENLSVTLDGGNGAKGQDGGDGGNGGRGSDVEFKIRTYYINHQHNGIITEAPLPNIGYQGIPATRVDEITRDGWEPAGPEGKTGDHTYDQDWKLPGGRGGNGGNAGRGGKGGEGGNKGICWIIEGTKRVNLGKKYHAEDGKPGKNGEIGRIGNEGKGGRSAKGVWHRGGNPDNYWSGIPWQSPHYIEGENGNKGNIPNKLNEENWKKSVTVKRENLLLSLLNYQIFLKLTAQRHETICNFLNLFHSYVNNIDTADTEAFVRDLIEVTNALEKHFTEHNKIINFAPFYYALLYRIRDVALNHARTPQELKVLEYLYVATLGNIARINAAADNLLVIDILGYLRNLANHDFKNLQKLKANELKAYYKQQYQDQIEDKIDEAGNFIDILKNEVILKQKKIEPKIVKLIGEIKAEKDKGVANLKDTQDKRLQLEQLLHQKMVFNIVQITIQAIGMVFPPAGPIVAGVINAGLSLAMEPTFESAMAFASKVVEMKSKLGTLPQVSNVTKNEADLFSKINEFAKLIEPLIKNVKDLLIQKNIGNEKLKQLDDQIVKVNAYIQELNVFLAIIPKALHDYLDNMVHEVQNFQQALQDKSLAALDFSKLEIKHFLENIKTNVKNLVGKFNSSNSFEDIVARIAEIVDVHIAICCRVQDYRDHIAFANFIAHMHMADIEAINVGSEYQNDINLLRLNIQKNIASESYCRAVTAVKQWSFPFGIKFLQAIPNLDSIDNDVSAQALPNLLRLIENYFSNITSMDQSIMKSTFELTRPSIPFYSWSYDEYPKQIDNLLTGNKTILSADVEESKLDVTKFFEIDFKLVINSKSSQGELDNLLQDNFKVSLKHSGVSYYKYESCTYQISSDKPIEIIFSFKKGQDGRPIIRNEVWDKMSKGDIILSPYTSWVISLEPLPTVVNHSNLFAKFNSYKNQMKISLVGKGSYVDVSKVNGDLRLNDFYYKANALKLIKGISQSKTPKSNELFSSNLKHIGFFSKQKMPISIPGLVYKSVPGDGNCLFYAVALYLGRDQKDLRNTVADYLQANINNPLIQAGLAAQVGQHGSFQNYINAIRNGIEWADDLEISTLMQCFNRPIYIIQENGSVREPSNPQRYAGEPIFVYYNGHNHYDALILDDSITAQAIVASLPRANRRNQPAAAGLK